MKIIEATWEKRNLGVTCVEIEIEKKDSIFEVINTIQLRKDQYIVTKVAVGRTDILFALQREGFLYIETLFEIVNKTLKRTALSIPEKLYNIGYHIVRPDMAYSKSRRYYLTRYRES